LTRTDKFITDRFKIKKLFFNNDKIPYRQKDLLGIMLQYHEQEVPRNETPKRITRFSFQHEKSFQFLPPYRENEKLTKRATAAFFYALNPNTNFTTCKFFNFAIIFDNYPTTFINIFNKPREFFITIHKINLFI